jgi:vacuolar-type H+-ATPase subunit E/Vma4
MGIKELEGKILSEADTEAADIEKASLKEAKEIEKDFKERASGERDRILSEARRNALLSRREILSEARLSAKAKVLECRRRLLDDLFEEAGEMVLSLPPGEKKRVYARLLGDAEVLGSDVVVCVSDADKKLVPRKYKTRRGEESGFGVVIESEDGARRIDNRLSPVLENIRSKLEPQLASILWG